MSSLPTLSGSPVFLRWQLHDYSTDKVVKAHVRNSVGALLTIVTLTHIGNGLYTDTSILMGTEVLTVTYYTYASDGLTLLSNTYGAAMDTFHLPAPPEGPTDISDLSLAEIRRIVNLVRQIDLDVLYDDDLLNVNLADDELIVTSKDEEELFINIDSDELEVLLDDDELNIKISCQ